MLIESDLFIAYMKKEDWLKQYAEKIFTALQKGDIQNIQTSTDVIHELYYIFKEYVTTPIMLGNLAKIATMENITYIDPTREIILSAVELASSYGFTSIFDAIYAATALTNQVPDHIVLSSDSVYDRVPGLQRIDPREYQLP
jgi:predicted nucleic acid-binding protein